MNKNKIFGWVLLPLNIIGLWFCVWALQDKFHIAYLFGTGLFVAQIIYIVKTLKALEQFEVSKEKLESVIRKSGLTMVNLLRGRKER